MPCICLTYYIFDHMPGICLTCAWHMTLIHMPGIWQAYTWHMTIIILGPIPADPSMFSRRHRWRSLRRQPRSYIFRRPRARLTCPLAATCGGCRLAEASERAITVKRVRGILRLCENQDRHWCQHVQMLINSYQPMTSQIDIKER
jgi:hypothetical protein